MPPFTMHMTLARELASQIGHAALREHPGAYYLGATAPDIRAITGWDRSQTHFFTLDEFGDQRGVASLLEAHGELAERGRLRDDVLAFLLGYISHLEMDETWICDIYRPCFGEKSPLEGGLLANLLDRILQFELDRQGRCDAAAVDEIRRDLVRCAVDFSTPIVDQETLVRWRDVLVEILGRPLEWERFGKSRHVKSYGVGSGDDLAKFLSNIPDMLDQSVREVTPERLAAFQEQSRRRAREAILEYLA
ncbi:MAG: zinc dependent phospholipase C family protein [Dehalococcoidia bacterium]